jgi:hypothetical protein
MAQSTLELFTITAAAPASLIHALLFQLQLTMKPILYNQGVVHRMTTASK